MDLATLSLPELRRLQTRVAGEITKREASGKKNLLKRMQQLAAEQGLTLADVLPGVVSTSDAPIKKVERKGKGVAAASRKKVESKAKYANPADPAATWSGRGRKPGWVNDWLASGKALSDLEIKKSGA